MSKTTQGRIYMGVIGALLFAAPATVATGEWWAGVVLGIAGGGVAAFLVPPQR